MHKDIIDKIIEAGNLAPSGGNSQPWKFIVENEEIKVLSLPEKDHKIFNFKERGTHVAHGALIENIEIASKFYGYKAVFDLFPERGVSTKIAFIEMNSSDTKDNSLYEAIATRHSNRRPFDRKILSSEQKMYLAEDARKFSDCKFLMLEGALMEKASKGLGADILIQLRNKQLHSLLFQEVLWRESDQKKQGGLYIKTMEMLPPKSLIFRMFKNWNFSKIMDKIKFTEKIYIENSKKTASAGLFGAITVANNEESFVNAGRLLENIWLRATKLNLEFQLTSGILFLWQQVNADNREIFSQLEKDIINQAYEDISGAFKTSETIALVFRIGKANPPSAVSYKRPPEIEWR